MLDTRFYVLIYKCVFRSVVQDSYGIWEGGVKLYGDIWRLPMSRIQPFDWRVVSR